MKETIKQGAL